VHRRNRLRPRRFNKTTTLNGAPPPNRVVIVQFESMAEVKDWWESEDQKAATKIGGVHPV